MLTNLLLALGFFASIPAFADAGGWHDGPLVVTSGHSIQAAIDSSHPGQLIIVEAGIYAEQLTVTTDGIHLVSKGAVLVPPGSFTPNTCSGLAGPETEAGICISGQDIVLADFVQEHRKVLSVGQPVCGVVVTGFEIRNFTGLNIAVVGGQDVQVMGNTLQDGSQYGALTVGSKRTHIDANVVASTGDILFIAVCMDDTSDVKVTNNDVSGYAVGLCVQTAHAYVANNRVTKTCWGVFVDPTIEGAQILNNDVSDPDPICSTFPGGGVLGIVMVGASDTKVQGNTVQGMKSGGAPDIPVGGIAIFDDPNTGAIANGNMVTGNVLHDNDIDINLYTNGTGNVVEGNQCTTPAALCG
jgi:nitrous oxidase accessory protein NosD